MSRAHHSGPHVVTTDAELEALIGSPDERVKMKLLVADDVSVGATPSATW